MDKSGKAHLFVYGTLRKRFPSHEILRRLRAQFLAEGSVQGRLYDLGEYPGAVPRASDADRIRGELYALRNGERAFKVLDRFEGYEPENPARSLFERREVTVILAGGEQARAWIYWLRRARGSKRRVLSGNYAMNRR